MPGFDESADLRRNLWWSGNPQEVDYDRVSIARKMSDQERRFYLLFDGNRYGICESGELSSSRGADSKRCLGIAASVKPESLGSAAFRRDHRTRYAYQAGGMAQGIASTDMVIALGKHGMLGTFGTGGLSAEAIAAAIAKVKGALPDGPYAFNLLNNPGNPDLERRTVELFLEHGVRTVEAAAYMSISPALVQYRASGISRGGEGNVVIRNRLIAKTSRDEVAEEFMKPAPAAIVQGLVEQRLLTREQAELSQRISMADDITAEADSGGHTDKKSLLCLIPAMTSLSARMRVLHPVENEVRVGAGGGIGTPMSALAAFMMGASYVVTGTVNQTSLEAGTSETVKRLLAGAGMSDVAMAPSADMFELGAKVQVLKKGTMFSVHAQKMYELYRTYDSIESIPQAERARLEERVLRKTIPAIWEETVEFLRERAPQQLRAAMGNGKLRMALIFRWYLGQSSKWACRGESGREMDYQIWCGPSIGPFNGWVRGSYLEKLENRRVADIGLNILTGAAYLCRLRTLESFGFPVDASARPEIVPLA